MTKKQDIETRMVDVDADRRERDSDRRETRSDRRSPRTNVTGASRRKIADRRHDGPGLDVQADKINTVSPSNL